MFAIFKYSRARSACSTRSTRRSTTPTSAGLSKCSGYARPHPVHPDHPQPPDDGDCQPAVRRDDGGAGVSKLISVQLHAQTGAGGPDWSALCPSVQEQEDPDMPRNRSSFLRQPHGGGAASAATSRWTTERCRSASLTGAPATSGSLLHAAQRRTVRIAHENGEIVVKGTKTEVKVTAHREVSARSDEEAQTRLKDLKMRKRVAPPASSSSAERRRLSARQVHGRAQRALRGRGAGRADGDRQDDERDRAPR